MRRKLITSLVGIVLVAAALLGTNLGLGYQPALGLDLRGGISVTLRPAPNQDYTPESLDLAVERIRERVDSKGVGEPEIVRQSDAIVVNLPGVNDQQAALDLVNVTGKVYLRPVLGCFTPAPATTPTSVDGSSTTAVDTGTTVAGTPTTDAAGTAATDAASTPSSTPNTAGDVVDNPVAETNAPGPSRAVHATTTDTIDTTDTTDATETTDATTSASSDTPAAPATDPGTTDTTVAGASTTVVDASSTTVVADPNATTTTALPYSDPTQAQILPDRNGQQCQVGPSGGDGTVFEKDSAAAQIIGSGWGVTVGLKPGGAGEGVWNALASSCFSGGSTCPSRQLAIELDGEIQSAPTVNAPSFTGNVQITGQFSRGEAEKLAQVLNSGALPVTLVSEQVENVSASLGEDSLRAALVAGAIGVVLVVIFMVFYYRRLAVVVIGGLLISGALIYSVTSLISRFYNGVLSLSGIAGLIVAIGVTIDSYVVFFERLKDEVRGGRTLRNSAQRGFTAAFRTILIADAVSLIGAAVLWYLSVGAVRGFAFYLGLSTVIDILVAYFFTRPAVLLLARSGFMGRSKVLGVGSTESAQLTGATT